MNYIAKEIANVEFLMEDLQEGIWKIDKDAFTSYVNDKFPRTFDAVKGKAVKGRGRLS